MKLDLFFANNPVFTIKDLKNFLGFDCKKSSTLSNLLQYHQKHGHILLIRRGLYAVIPKEAQGFKNFIDPYLVANKLSEDSVLAYQTALALHGKNNTISNLFYYLTRTRKKKDFEFQGNIYRAVSIPSPLIEIEIGIVSINRLGLNIYLTSLERTFVDVLDRPYLCLSWEEICRSIDSIEYMDLDAILKYTSLLHKCTTAAVVGFFLEMHKEKWHVSLAHLDKLQKICPKKPFYLKRAMKGPRKLIHKWNLIVPQSFLDKNWEEPHEDI
ncbi:MAG: hypothetical protein K940chlam5_00943 [Candidatus Anoxychlamydiales bacterium]|nr:hypothetical protein [Candidatus Anoxychlamydiales bacterium]